MAKKTWTDEQLVNAVVKCDCVTHIAHQLGLSPKGGNYNTIKKHILRLGLDTTHFETLTDRMNRVRKHSMEKTRYTDEEALESLFKLDTNCWGITKRYAKKFLDATKCSLCSQPVTWNNRPLTLQLDHINGNRKDNRLENLRFVCPNCHSQTDTFSGRNKAPVTHR